MRFHCILGLMAVTVVFLYGSPASGQNESVRRVLILNENGTQYPAVELIDRGIRESLAKSSFRIQYYREYMDTVLFPDPADQREYRERLIRRYVKRRPDLIVTVGAAPLRLMADIHQQYWPGIPIVYCLPSGLEKELELGPEFTGVTGEIRAAETVEAALRLVPKTKHVFVVAGAGEFDAQQAEVVKGQLTALQNRVDISFLAGMPMPALLTKLANLPPDSIVLFTTYSKDPGGALFVGTETGPLISQASNVPVFSLFDTYIDHGEVGGDLSSILDQGRLAGSMAKKILDGEKPSAIPPAVAVNSLTFDARALDRWGVNERDLPTGSVLLNRQPSKWQLYKWYICGFILLVLVETLLISGLLWQRARRRKTEIDLARSNERLRLAVEVSKSVGWDWNILTGRNLWFGDLETIFGIHSDTHETTVGDFMNYVHPDDRKLVGAAVASARDEQKPYVAEFRIVRNDETIRWITARGRFEYSSQGVPERMIGMAMDITERMQAEHKIGESEQRFRLLADTAPVKIWTSGIDGGCDYFNRRWLEFTGRSMEDESGRGWTQGVHPDDLDYCLRTYKSAFDSRQAFDMEYRLRRFDGEYRWHLDRGAPRVQTDGSFAGYIGSCIDITEQKLAQEALTNLSGRLISVQEEERKRIAREIHDDYQQRLALVANDLDGLRDHLAVSDEDARRMVRHLWNEISELAADLHSLSHRLHSSTLENLGLTAGVRAFCQEFEEQQELRIQFTSADLPRRIPSDSALCLFRVAQEALRNVKRHSGADHAEVKLEWTGDAVHLMVSDSGRGFDTRMRSADAGIGIRSMEERLRLVAGRFEVHSKPLHGTRIDAWVPVKATTQATG